MDYYGFNYGFDFDLQLFAHKKGLNSCPNPFFSKTFISDIILLE